MELCHQHSGHGHENEIQTRTQKVNKVISDIFFYLGSETDFRILGHMSKKKISDPVSKVIIPWPSVLNNIYLFN